MGDRLMRRQEVEKITGLGRSSIYRLMQKGDFPRPVRVGPAAVRWMESEVTAWVESRPVAMGDLWIVQWGVDVDMGQPVR